MPRLSSRHVLAPLSLALGLLLAATSGPAFADSARRLHLDVQLKRDGSTDSTVDTGRGRLVQTLTLSAILHTEGTPSPSNPLDPDDGQRQLARAQRDQQRMQAALAASGAPRAAAPDLAALQARAQQLMARCGNDSACLMREASSLSAAQVAAGDAALQGRLQQYGHAAADCEQRPAAARDACRADARRRAGGGDDVPDGADETPYLVFTGRADCQLQTQVSIDHRIEGSFADVQGTVPFTDTTQARQARRDDTLCPLLQVVLDQRSGRLWTHVMIVDGAPGTRVRAERGRQPQRHEGPMQLQWLEAQPWLQRRLSNLDAGGEDRLRQAVPGGQVEAVVRWRFEPV